MIDRPMAPPMRAPLFETWRAPILFAAMGLLLLATGMFQSWAVAFGIIALCLISAVMALGVNIQWGYAGLFNAGIMGFAALGGVAAMLTSVNPVPEAWAVGRVNLGLALLTVVGTIGLILFARDRVAPRWRMTVSLAIGFAGYVIYRQFLDPAAAAISRVNPAAEGFLGGAGLPIILSWAVGGLMAAGAAYVIGKIALGLRSDYLAIATLGISEIILAVIKNEDWLTRGVKNVSGLPRPVPTERELRAMEWFDGLSDRLGIDPITLSTLIVRGSYVILFLLVLAAILWLSERALNSPWGRMMRAIRDNRDAAAAMGKDVTGRQLQVFVLGSAVVGIAGAMLTTLEGQLTPTSYNPLRFTFLIWVMVIVGGSGNNWGAVLGGFLIWFVWVQAEPAGGWLLNAIANTVTLPGLVEDRLQASAPHLRLFLMGVILLTVLRFAPRGLIPEKRTLSPA